MENTTFKQQEEAVVEKVNELNVFSLELRRLKEVQEVNRLAP